MDSNNVLEQDGWRIKKYSNAFDKSGWEPVLEHHHPELAWAMMRVRWSGDGMKGKCAYCGAECPKSMVAAWKLIGM